MPSTTRHAGLYARSAAHQRLKRWEGPDLTTAGSKNCPKCSYYLVAWNGLYPRKRKPSMIVDKTQIALLPWSNSFGSSPCACDPSFFITVREGMWRTYERIDVCTSFTTTMYTLKESLVTDTVLKILHFFYNIPLHNRERHVSDRI